MDSHVLNEIAAANPASANMSLLTFWCETEVVDSDDPRDPVYPPPVGVTEGPTKEVGISECEFITCRACYSQKNSGFYGIGCVSFVVGVFPDIFPNIFCCLRVSGVCQYGWVFSESLVFLAFQENSILVLEKCAQICRLLQNTSRGMSKKGIHIFAVASSSFHFSAFSCRRVHFPRHVPE